MSSETRISLDDYAKMYGLKIYVEPDAAVCDDILIKLKMLETIKRNFPVRKFNRSLTRKFLMDPNPLDNPAEYLESSKDAHNLENAERDRTWMKDGNIKYVVLDRLREGKGSTHIVNDSLRYHMRDDENKRVFLCISNQPKITLASLHGFVAPEGYKRILCYLSGIGLSGAVSKMEESGTFELRRINSTDRFPSPFSPSSPKAHAPGTPSQAPPSPSCTPYTGIKME